MRGLFCVLRRTALPTLGIALATPSRALHSPLLQIPLQNIGKPIDTKYRLAYISLQRGTDAAPRNGG